MTDLKGCGDGKRRQGLLRQLNREPAVAVCAFTTAPCSRNHTSTRQPSSHAASQSRRPAGQVAKWLSDAQNEGKHNGTRRRLQCTTYLGLGCQAFCFRNALGALSFTRRKGQRAWTQFLPCKSIVVQQLLAAVVRQRGALLCVHVCKGQEN